MAKKAENQESALTVVDDEFGAEAELKRVRETFKEWKDKERDLKTANSKKLSEPKQALEDMEDTIKASHDGKSAVKALEKIQRAHHLLKRKRSDGQANYIHAKAEHDAALETFEKTMGATDQKELPFIEGGK